MWLFILSDACTFGALLFAYGYIRNSAADWPQVLRAASIWNSLLMTFILVGTSLTVLFAVRAAQSEDWAGAFRWTMITAGGGLLFTLLHIKEWLSLIGQGARLFQNPWGSPMFGAAFSSITGLHDARSGRRHRFGCRRTQPTRPAVTIEIWAQYWHFVDLVWMFVVPLVYLLNMKR